MSGVNLEWNVCRVCLQESDDMTSIFDENDVQIKVFEKMMQCSSVVVKPNANLPELICKPCLSDLEIAYHFRHRCESSDAVLNSIIESTSPAPEMNVTISTGEIYKFRPPSGLKVSKTTTATAATATEVANSANETQFSQDEFNTTHFLLTPKQEIIDDQDFMVIESIAENEDDEFVKGEEMTTYEVKQKSDHEEEEVVEEEEEEEEGEKEEYNEPYEMIKIQESDRVPKRGRPKKQTEATDISPTTFERRLIRIKRVFDDPKPLKICELCGNTYKYQHALNSHMRRHRNEKPYVCQICDKAFVINFELTRHMRTHTGQKPYACKYCDRKFSDFGSRIKHERTHTGERPYACETCGKTFAYSHVLSSHMVIHTGIKNYECKICMKRFTKAHHLKAHTNTHERYRPLRMQKPLVTIDKEEKHPPERLYEDVMTVLTARTYENGLK